MKRQLDEANKAPMSVKNETQKKQNPETPKK